MTDDDAVIERIALVAARQADVDVDFLGQHVLGSLAGTDIRRPEYAGEATRIRLTFGDQNRRPEQRVDSGVDIDLDLDVDS